MKLVSIMRTIFPIVFLVVLLPVFSGCDLAKPQAPVADTPVQTVPVQEPVPQTPAPQENSTPVQQADSAITVTPAEQPATPETAAQPEQKEDTVRVKADVGAGKKGHYGQKGGEDATDIITVPVATLFRAKEMAAYRIQVPQALQLYKAMNDGKGPETNKEFMEKIIKANNIPLPELPEGQRYVYDPEKEELMVEKPKVQQ